MPRAKVAKICAWCKRDFMSTPEVRFCSYKCGGRASFWSRVEKTDGCWIWNGALDKDGYGASTVRVGGKRVGSQIAHVIAYEELVKPVPAGLQLDHKCRNRRCVNPDHLEPVTCAVNLERSDTLWAKSRRTGLCRNGHPRVPENIRTRKNGKSDCRICARAQRRQWRLLHPSVTNVASTGDIESA